MNDTPHEGETRGQGEGETVDLFVALADLGEAFGDVNRDALQLRKTIDTTAKAYNEEELARSLYALREKCDELRAAVNLNRLAIRVSVDDGRDDEAGSHEATNEAERVGEGGEFPFDMLRVPSGVEGVGAEPAAGSGGSNAVPAPSPTAEAQPGNAS